MSKRRKLVVLKQQPPKPAPEPGWPLLDGAAKLAIAVLCIFGAISVLGWLDGRTRPEWRETGPRLPPPGWECIHIEHETAAGRTHERACRVANGWHFEELSDGRRIVVRDSPWRRPFATPL